jgi:hypothetical protein
VPRSVNQRRAGQKYERNREAYQQHQLWINLLTWGIGATGASLVDSLGFVFGFSFSASFGRLPMFSVKLGLNFSIGYMLTSAFENRSSGNLGVNVC